MTGSQWTKMLIIDGLGLFIPCDIQLIYYTFAKIDYEIRPWIHCAF